MTVKQGHLRTHKLCTAVELAKLRDVVDYLRCSIAPSTAPDVTTL